MIKQVILTTTLALYRLLLRMQPRSFRETFGAEMHQTCASHLRDVIASGPWWIVLWAGLRELADLFTAEPAQYASDNITWGEVGRETFSTAVYALAIFVLINFFVPRYVVHGASMQPNFHDGDRLITSRMPYLFGDPQRGDVVVLNRPDDLLLKRVVGLPGETVVIQDGEVFVNGEPLKEPYISAPPGDEGQWTLGPTSYFVLGDNRNRSNDSADFGPIDRTQIVSRVFVIFWPPSDWGLLP